MDEFLLLLQAKIDEAKSKGIINADIEAIQKQINHLKLQAEVDTNSLKNITQQLSAILNQRIIIDNVQINSNQATKIGQQTGQQIGNAISQGISSNLKNIKNDIDNTIKTAPRLDVNKIIGDLNLNRASVGSDVISQIRSMASEINKLGLEVVKTGNDSSWEKLISKSSELGKILDEYGKIRNYPGIENVRNFASYFEGKTISTGYKNSGLSGTDYTTTQLNKELKELGVKFSSAKQEAMDLNRVWVEMCETTGRMDLLNISNAQDQIQTVISELLKAQSILYGEDGLSPHPNSHGIVSDYITNITNTRTAVENLESEMSAIRQKEVQEAATAADAVVQNEEKKQQAIRETGNAYRELSYSNNTDLLKTFSQSLANIGMEDDKIQKVSSDIDNLNVKINFLKQSQSSNGILSVTVEGIDEYGQAIKLMRQYETETGDLVKGIDAVSSAQEKASASTKNFEKQQAAAVASFTNQINQLNRAANDKNASRPITDSTHLSSLSDAYNNIISAIEKLGNASQDTFSTEQNNVRTLISEYKSLVSELRNAENVATKMKGTNFNSGLTIAQNDLEKFKASARDFPQIANTIANLESSIVNVTDTASLNTFNDQLRVARSELAELKATFASATKQVNLTNKIQKWLDNNTRATKEARNELEIYLKELSSGQITNARWAEMNNGLTQIDTRMRSMGKLGKSFMQTFTEGMKKFSYWTSSTFVIMKTFTEIKQGINTIKQLDTALVDLKKTTTMTEQELENFYYSANETAKQMGVTTQQIIEQASAWSRLGYSSAEAATQMAKYSSMFAMISPGMDIDSATDGLVSVMKAFKIGAEDVNDVVDGIMSKVNVIGNTRALSNSDIVEFLTRSSAAMAEANNTLDETIALGTAMVEITRDAANAGQVLKTVSMRIRGYDEETEEYVGGVEELSGKIADLTKTASTPGGISLFSDAAKTEYKSTLQLFREIDQIYDQLDDKTQAQLLEALAGKRNGQAVAAILNNFEAVEDSLNSMANSTGNAEAEMAIAMDSMDYKVNIFKETWTGIAQNLFAREDMKSILDIINSFGEGIDFLTEKLGLLGSIGLGTGIFAGIKNIGKHIQAYSFQS